MDPDKDKVAADVPTKADVENQAPPAGERETTQETASANEGPDAADQNPAAEKPAAREPEPRPQPGKAGRAVGTIALILAVVACLASAYLWYSHEVQGRRQQDVTAATLTGEVKVVTESVRALEKQQDRLSEVQDKVLARQEELTRLVNEKLESSLSSLEAEMQQSMETLQAQQRALGDSVGKVYESMDRSIDSWALEEVEQLLRMANHSVSLAGDISNGITALDFADKRLAELGNPELLEVRRLIAEELGRLRAVDRTDLPGLAFSLSGLIAAVDRLPLIDKPVRPEAADEGADGKPEDNMWAQAGYELLDDLKGLIRIQNVSEPARPLLAPEQRYFLTGNLRLLLSGAQIAVLNADTNTFKANLEQATQILNDHFDTGEQSVRAILDELQAMAGETLAVERPDISGSLAKLREVKPKVTTQ